MIKQGATDTTDDIDGVHMLFGSCFGLSVFLAHGCMFGCCCCCLMIVVVV